MRYRPGSPITKPKLLLGEGIDEVFFFTALVDSLGIQDIQVDQYGGKSHLRSGLKALMKRSGFVDKVESLGITRDADFPDDSTADAMTAAPSAFQSVCGVLESLDLPVPSTNAATAFGPPNVAVFILPDGTNPGMLEDVCLTSVSTEPEYDCLVEFFDCVAKRSGNAPTLQSQAKAHLHAWLSTRETPDKRLGEAAQSGYWDWSNDAFDDLISFVQAL